MPRYYFDIRNGHRLIDPAGLDCRDDRAAIQAGKVIAQQIAIDVQPTQARRIEILDSDRLSVATIAITIDGDSSRGDQAVRRPEDKT
jgi:hypothetical protein